MYVMQFTKVYIVRDRVQELERVMWGLNYASSREKSYEYVLNEDDNYLEIYVDIDEVMKDDTLNAIFAELNIEQTKIEVDYDCQGLRDVEYIALDVGLKALKLAVPIPLEYIELHHKMKGFPYYLNEAFTKFAYEFGRELDRLERQSEENYF